MYDSFVKSFVFKHKRPRYSIDENRSELLNKLCHNWDEALDPRYSIMDGSPKYIQLAKSIIGKSAYCISLNEEFDGKILIDASPFQIDVGFPVVLVYNVDLAWFKTESCPRADVYFLARK